MPEDNSNPFRERHEIKSEGSLVEAPRPKGPKGLVVNEESYDLKRDFSDLIGKPPEMAGADKVTIEKEGFTVEDVEVGKLDEALEAMKREQSDMQTRGLIEEASRLIDEGDFAAAINMLEAAREIAPTSALVLYLLGFCLFSVKRFDDAYGVLNAAEPHCDSAEMRALVVGLKGACMRAIVEAVEAELVRLKKTGREAAALRLVEDRLQQYPSSASLLYHRCAVLISLGRAEQARQAAEEAIERGGEKNADFFRQILEQATLLEYRPLLEPARQALRTGEAAKAVKLLRACRSTLNQLPFYETVCVYAREQVPVSSGFASILSRKHEQSGSLKGEPLQKVLRWLLSDELDAAYNALDKPDYAAAIVHLRRAASIDSKCSRINYLHGLAIYRTFLLRLNDQTESLDLELCAKDLRRAAGYIQQAADDPALEQRSKELGNAIKSYQEQVAEILREYAQREKEARPIKELLKKYNDFMDYLERSSIPTMKDWNAAREKFLNFKQQAQTLRQGRSKEQGAEFLDKLTEAFDHALQTLNKMQATVQKHTLLNECLIEYKEMMDRYSRYGIPYSELSLARTRVSGLLMKLLRAREALGYDPNQDSGKVISMREYVNNWQPDERLNPGESRTRPNHVDKEAWEMLNLLEKSLLDISKQLGAADF